MSLSHASSSFGVGHRVRISCCQLWCIRLTLPKNTEHGIFPRRASTSSSSSFKDDDKSSASRLYPLEFESEWKILYHRNPSRNTTPRAFFGISTFNFLYWAWYVFDFTPAINSSAQTKFELGKIDPAALEMLLIDSNMGYIGMGVSSVIWLGAFLYSRQLVSAIWATQPTDEEEDCRLAVATLKLPFLTQPKILLKTVYDPESNSFDGSVEDIRFTDSDVKSTPSVEIFAPGELGLCEDKIQHDAIVKYDGDFRRLRGHIALKKTNENTATKGPITELLEQKFLMDISSSEEVMPNASSTLRYHLFSRDYRLSSLKRKEHVGRKNLGNANSNAMTSEERRRRLRNSDMQRPVSQLEMARGILNESMRRKK